MSHNSAPPQDPPTRGGPAERDCTAGDPSWLRPALVFLLGILVGTLVMAATRPLPESGWPSITNDVTTSNPTCQQVVAGSQHLADLAARTANAAQHQDATSLTELARELSTTQNSLDADVLGCHP